MKLFLLKQTVYLKNSTLEFNGVTSALLYGKLEINLLVVLAGLLVLLNLYLIDTAFILVKILDFLPKISLLAVLLAVMVAMVAGLKLLWTIMLTLVWLLVIYMVTIPGVKLILLLLALTTLLLISILLALVNYPLLLASILAILTPLTLSPTLRISTEDLRLMVLLRMKRLSWLKSIRTDLLKSL